MLKFVLFILSILPVAESKQDVASVYAGTWQAQNGNTMFIVSLWQQGSDIYGHYKLVTYNNGIAGNTIFNSNRDIAAGLKLPFTISTNVTIDGNLSGFVYDNTIENNPNHFKDGNLSIKLIQPVIIGCTNCVIQATWKVESGGDLVVGDETLYSVPTNIILTKVSNTINLD